MGPKLEIPGAEKLPKLPAIPTLSTLLALPIVVKVLNHPSLQNLPDVSNIRKIPRAHIAAVAFIISALSLIILSPWSWEMDDSSWSHHRHKYRDEDRKFALVVPATSPSPDLCKTVVTALALGYPSPVIINWGIDHRLISHWNGGHNLPKIPGIVDYLDAVLHPDAHPSERLSEDDIILMVDGHDVWFQLPAQIMLERYHRINKEANERLRKQWNKKGKMPMQQTILVATGKKCYSSLADKGINIQCEKWPESPERKDLYGPDTEKDGEHWQTNRPRWINGGVYIGPAGDMRRLFRRSLFTMQAGIGEGIKMHSEQALTGEVVVEQEIFRKFQREKGRPRRGIRDMLDKKLEYGIGLDYGQQISMQTQWTQDDEGRDHGAFVTLGDQKLIDEHSAALGISPTRLKGLPEDIKNAENPLELIQPDADWNNMSLYADFFLETVPVILHHNGMHGLKRRRSTWWDKPWYYHHLRELLKMQIQKKGEPEDPLATVKTENGRVRYWGVSAEYESRYPRQMVDNAFGRLDKMKLGEICRHTKKAPQGPNQEWWEEVFRDTEGPWGH
ncbi:hypothetical protein FPRO06_13084 [Fusarium proliferatum]|nr:hypothetical protein FPRO06_13084 [Fusarium proliferatum]CVL11787.1 uncharacterized protein FPRN_14837 [Fusarium proliferatum]